ncbi:hypothetical protein GQ55_5G412400 [Panicum hallii var. hallii]|uniref:Uncharacterized protein n=2 Tax=Panicum sect. Panicum TaxID=2100772 RepID=A0A3L6QWU3_PANMI|nr:hypothetical protein GQ55_5G412400 [Panicum hallii var. hallii]RLM91196.1 uncharacterized protein C2845_PM08G10250 [Panicum miliaceum]
MAADGTPLLRASAFAFTIDGAIAALAGYYDDPVEELARRRGRDAAKRGRDGGTARREEADAARGWSSAVAERGLALRRRGGSASCSRPRGGLVVGGEEAAAPGAALGAGAKAAAAAAKPMVDPGVAFFCLAVL